MENMLAILRVIIMIYNEHNITGYKSYMADGVNSFMSTKNTYILYFNQFSPKTLETLDTPYGKIKVSSGGYIPNELDPIIYNKIFNRIKGQFINPYTFIINRVDDIPISVPLIKSTYYTDDEITNTFYIVKPYVCAFSNTNGNLYNYEIERLVSLGIIDDEEGLLRKIRVNEQAYYDAIDAICEKKMYCNKDIIELRKSPRLYHKYIHILGLLLLTDTPIKGLTY